jgi:prepilin-type N-terminal cleavage/methylation domain-containing protein
MKKAFTLLEMLVSITLFSIILIFLYQVLETTKNHNNKYEVQVERQLNLYELELAIFKDFANQKKIIEPIKEDKNKNHILQLQTNTTYHDPFYNHVVYFLSRDNELIRIESKKLLNFSNLSASLENSFVDIVENNVEKFQVTLSEDKSTYFFYIEYLNGKSLYFSIKKDI